jgi:hypothetical protein
MMVGRKSRRVNAGKRRTGMHPARIGHEANADDRSEVAEEPVLSDRSPPSNSLFCAEIQGILRFCSRSGLIREAECQGFRGFPEAIPEPPNREFWDRIIGKITWIKT